MQVIIYKQDNSRVAVVYPTQEAVELYGIELIAQKDVPHGKAFKIIDSEDIPQDRNQRADWTVDDADLTDGVGAEWSVFPEAQSQEGQPDEEQP